MNNIVTAEISSLIASLKELSEMGCTYVDLSILESEFDEELQETMPASLVLEAHKELDNTDMAIVDTLDSLK